MLAQSNTLPKSLKRPESTTICGIGSLSQVSFRFRLWLRICMSGKKHINAAVKLWLYAYHNIPERAAVPEQQWLCHLNQPAAKLV